MRAGTLVLYTDQPARRADLRLALQQIAPCAVLDAAAMPPSGPCLALVADLDLLQPSPLVGLRTLIAETPALPRVFLMRSMGERSLSAARSLGARLCLPMDTPAETVVEALRAQLSPPAPKRGPDQRAAGAPLIVQAADQAGAVIAKLLDAARGSGTVDATLVDRSLDPILGAIGQGGLTAWLDTVRAYDDATYQHCLLVAGLAATFAIDLGFSAADRQQLVRAALVHDVGKAKIPLEILNKAGPLDPAERAVMREHAVLGHEILVRAGGFDDAVLAVVRHHHELLDGSGYPDGLAGDAIDDIVRLITVCDVYAALVERRPYRAPMPAAEALKILKGMDGKLDAALVRAFERSVAGS
ncbi:HD-GYP domain-containing protein [Methylobacterium sp. NEAU K]|uniref:HD-GYP domain-containing protein n=1 Tax=Methylobacterium sp. NEAU K TaxID=3064946 RepID=UPI002734B1F7|nr:HD-GYP domain-containing protein [Methylobacterium sp. NEAU K]MDP4003216.1 HD-GYP domain-containing protein [Methylobacterium sp. NEAU K]